MNHRSLKSSADKSILRLVDLNTLGIGRSASPISRDLESVGVDADVLSSYFILVASVLKLLVILLLIFPILNKVSSICVVVTS